MARVGFTEAEAIHRRLAIGVKSEETGEWFSNRPVGERTAIFKTIVEEGIQRVLGAHLLGPHAEEVINIFALAVRQGRTPRTLRT